MELIQIPEGIGRLDHVTQFCFNHVLNHEWCAKNEFSLWIVLVPSFLPAWKDLSRASAIEGSDKVIFILHSPQVYWVLQLKPNLRASDYSVPEKIWKLCWREFSQYISISFIPMAVYSKMQTMTMIVRINWLLEVIIS